MIISLSTALLLLLMACVGAVIGFLVACLCFQMRRVEAAECDDAVEFGYSITPQGRAALDADKSTRERQQQSGSVSLADLQRAADMIEDVMIEDTGERKAQDARDERRRRKRAEDPDAYRPLVTNPDDPTDTVL